MKACSLMIFGGVLLAAVISTNSFPATDGTSTTAPALTSKDGTSSVPAPPPVSPLIGSASSFTPIKAAAPLGSSESESKESDEKTSSTTAKSMFRRAADEDSGEDEDDDDDDGDDDDSTDESSSETRTKRQNPSSQYDLKGSLNQSQKPKDQSSESEEKPAAVPAIAKPANN